MLSCARRGDAEYALDAFLERDGSCGLSDQTIRTLFQSPIQTCMRHSLYQYNIFWFVTAFAEAVTSPKYKPTLT